MLYLKHRDVSTLLNSNRFQFDSDSMGITHFTQNTENSIY